MSTASSTASAPHSKIAACAANSEHDHGAGGILLSMARGFAKELCRERQSLRKKTNVLCTDNAWRSN